MSTYPEPPAVGSEVDTLLGSLERQRATFAFKCAGLTTDQLQVTVGASSLTLGGLLAHLAHMEDLNFTGGLAGRDLPAHWADLDSDEVWASARERSADDLRALWEGAVSRSREAVALTLELGQGLAATYEVRPGVPCSLRRRVVDLVEENARHTGHADLLRESIDGQVGEDPPGEPYPFSA